MQNDQFQSRSLPSASDVQHFQSDLDSHWMKPLQSQFVHLPPDHRPFNSAHNCQSSQSFYIPRTKMSDWAASWTSQFSGAKKKSQINCFVFQLELQVAPAMHPWMSGALENILLVFVVVPIKTVILKHSYLFSTTALPPTSVNTYLKVHALIKTPHSVTVFLFF